ncbi:MAG: zinc ribbon domain-containing protein [Chloroflexota bacterium]
MRKRIISFVILVTCLVFANSVVAQELVSFSVIEIDLWSEYDQPAMLVIYRMQLSEETVLPVELSFQIPASVGNPTAVANGSSPSTISDVDFTRTVEGEYAQINFVATGAYIQFEYYDASLNVEEKARHYEYFWPGDYAADAVVLRVKLPADSQSVNLPAGFSAGEVGADGYLYYELVGGESKAGDSLYIPISYSVGGDARQVYAWILGGLGVVLIAVGGVRYYKGSRKSKRGHKARRRQTASKPTDQLSTIFCHNCGEQARIGDKFCRNCGAELRTG